MALPWERNWGSAAPALPKPWERDWSAATPVRTAPQLSVVADDEAPTLPREPDKGPAAVPAGDVAGLMADDPMRLAQDVSRPRDVVQPVEPAPVAPRVPSPFDNEGAGALVERRGQEFGLGVTDMLSSAIRGQAALDASMQRNIQQQQIGLRQADTEALRAIDERIAGASEQDRPYLERQRANLLERAQNIAADAPEGFAIQERRSAAGSAMYGKAGDFDAWARETIGVPPTDDSFWSKFSSGAGSFAAFLAASIPATALGPAGVTAVGGSFGALANSGQVYDEAIQMGATEDQALDAAGVARVVGASEVLPILDILRPLERMLPGIRNKALAIAGKSLRDASEEGLQEGLATIANNLIASGYYDPTRGWSEGVTEAVVIGSMLGGAAGGAVGIATANRPPRAQTQAPPPPSNPQEPNPNLPLEPGDREGPIQTQLVQEGRDIIDKAIRGEPLPLPPQSADAVPPVEAPADLGNVPPEEAAMLLGMGYDAEAVADMSPQERAAEIAQARDMNVAPLPLDEVARRVEAYRAETAPAAPAASTVVMVTGGRLQKEPMRIVSDDGTTLRVEDSSGDQHDIPIRSIQDGLFEITTQDGARFHGEPPPASSVDLSRVGDDVIGPVAASIMDDRAYDIGGPMRPMVTPEERAALESAGVVFDGRGFVSREGISSIVDERNRRSDARQPAATPAPVAPAPSATESPVQAPVAAVAPALAAEPAVPAPAPAAQADGAVEMLDPATIAADPERFQFKSGTDAQGVSEQLRGVRQWDDMGSGLAVVWENAEGQRLGLAQRLQAEGQSPRLRAIVLREADGITAEEAMHRGAMKNIQEGGESTSSLDVAKVFRRGGTTEAVQASIPPRRQAYRDGVALARLGDDAFTMAINEVVPANYAAEVGRAIEGDAAQVAALKYLAENPPANATQARIIVGQMRATGFATETQDSLFGDQEIATPLFAERARIIDNAQKSLRMMGRVFKTAVDAEGVLSEAGNVLDSAANLENLTENQRLGLAIERLAQRKGPISDALSEQARRLAAKEVSVGQARQAFLEAVRDPERAAGAALGAVGRPNDRDGKGAEDRQVRPDARREVKPKAAPAKIEAAPKGDTLVPSGAGAGVDPGAQRVTAGETAPITPAQEVQLRRIAARAERLENEARPGRGVAVGSTGERAAQEATVMRDLVRDIRAGMAPEEAATRAKASAREIIARHNERRKGDVNWQVWEGSYDTAIDSEVGLYQRAEVIAERQRIADAAKAAPTRTGTKDDGATDLTPEGDQRVIEGAEQSEAKSKAAAAPRDKAEIEARQLQSKMRRAGQERVESDDGGLFGEKPADLFSEPPATPAKPAEPTKIEDFGEKIAGAKKDTWAAYSDKLKDAATVDIAAEPLSKSWPAPDYEAMIAEGKDPWTVAFVRVARDMIPTKPSVAWKVKGWARDVEMLRGFATKLIDGKIEREAVEAALLNDRLGAKMGGTIDLYLAVGHEKSLKGLRLSSASYSMYGGVRYSPERVFWEVQSAAKATAFSNMPRVVAKGDTKAEAIAAFKKVYGTLEGKTKAEANVRFDLYSRDKRQTWTVGKKVGAGHIDLRTFPTVAEARTYMREHEADLKAQLERIKDIPAERKAMNSPRVGADHRSGGNVTPQQFGEAFGFRGVQFGNWVEDVRRQGDLNEAYDALMDLAGIIGVPPRAMSLNGELGLAFGARGSGGMRPAAAHYEPGQVVINLTKKAGAGSLAHEWFHAVDSYFSRSRGQPQSYITDRPQPLLTREGRAENDVRDAVLEAFRNVRVAINQTSLKQRSANLDKTRSKAYWGTGIEMHARAFESYVITKLHDQNAANDYLANIVSPAVFDAEAALTGLGDNAYPYLTAGEIPVVRDAFDELFRVVETRETERGVQMFAKSRSPFYSAVLRAVEGMAQPKANGLQWMAMLRKAPGVKEEELNWLGLPTWLSDRKGITKQELIDYISANQVQVQEVTHGGGPTEWGDVAPSDTASAPFMDDWNRLSDEIRAARETMRETRWAREPGALEIYNRALGKAESLEAERDKLHEDMVAATIEEMGGLTKPTKFASYTLPGGQRYQELLITMPPVEPRFGVFVDGNMVLPREFPTAAEAREAGRTMGFEGRATVRQLDNKSRNADTYKSGHWDEANVLAHVRFNEREVNGERVLFIEEIQSDWHQAGRRKGYGNAKLSEAEGEALTEERRRLLRIGDEATAAEANAARARIIEIGEIFTRANSGVPDAPLKTTWHETAFRRAVAHAAKNGFDRVAWTPGAMQAERYDLSKQIREIEYTQQVAPYEGTYLLEVSGVGGEPVTLPNGGLFKADELPDVVGKEVADKIVSGGESGTLSGLDLKVGGEGMKGFYDRILPAYAKKWGKRFGADVATVNLTTTTGDARNYLAEPRLIAPADSVSGRWTVGIPNRESRYFDSEADARAALDAMIPRAEVWSLPITPAMRETVQKEGVPLFAKPRDARTFDAAPIVADLKRQLRAMNLPALRVEVADRLFARDADGNLVEVDGLFDPERGLIAVSLASSRGGKATLGHEAIHALKEAGLFRDAEWRALERAARADAAAMARAREEYPELDEAGIVEEVIADMFGDWRAGEAKGFVRSAFERIAAIIEALGNALRGNGFTSARDVFAAVERGDVGGRAGSPSGGMAMAAAKTRATDTAEFKRWFGDSKVVDANGEPLVVYHTTTYGADMEAFDQNQQMKGMAGFGFYFTDQIGANGYAAHSEKFKSQRSFDGKTKATSVMPAYLKMENPLRVEDIRSLFPQVERGQPGRFGQGRSFVGMSPDQATNFERQGYDGIITEEWIKPNRDASLTVAAPGSKGAIRHPVYVVFKPEQIKSAFNRGTFDPSDPRISFAKTRGFSPAAMAQVAATGAPVTRAASAATGLPLGSGFVAPDRTAWFRAIEKVDDRFHMLQRAQESIEESRGAPLPESVDAYLAQSLYDTRATAALKRMRADDLDPITAEMRKRNVSVDDIGLYLIAKHAPERNAEMAKRDPAKWGAGGGSGLTDQQAAAILAGFSNTADLDAVAQFVWRMTKRDLNRRHLAGLISTADYNTWTSMYQHYVPLRGTAERDDGAGQWGRVGRGYDIRGPESRQARGRTSLSDNPMVMAAMMAHEGVVRSEKNKVGKTFLRLVQAEPNDDLWRVVKIPMRPHTDPKTGAQVWLPDYGPLNRDNILSVKIAGKEKFIEIVDPVLAAAFKNLGASQLHPIMKAMRHVTRTFSRLNTGANPDFVLPNLQADLMEAALTAYANKQPGMTRAFAKNFPQAFHTVAGMEWGASRVVPQRWRDLHAEWEEQGGKIDFMAFRDLDELTDEIRAQAERGRRVRPKDVVLSPVKAVDGLLKAVEHINQPFEHVSRFAMYVAARELGMSKAKAAAMSLDASGNYTRRGEWTPSMSAAYAFINPAIKGIEKFGRIAGIRQGKSSPNVRVLAAYAGTVIAGYAMAKMVSEAFGDDDDPDELPLYWKIPYWERSRALLWPTGVTEETIEGPDGPETAKRLGFVPWRIAHNLRPLWTLGQAIYGVESGALSPEQATEEVMTAFMMNMNPLGSDSILNAIAPTALDPVVDLKTNRSWLDIPIRPDVMPWNEGVPASRQYFPRSTSDWSIMAAQGVAELTGGTPFEPGKVEVYPNQIEFLFDYFTGGFGRFIGRGVQLAKNVADGVETPPSRVPLGRMFYGRTDWRAEQSLYYDEAGDIKGRADALRAAKSAYDAGRPDSPTWEQIEAAAHDIGAIVERGKNIKWTESLRQPFNDADKALGDLRAEIVTLQQGGGPRRDSEAEIKRIEGQMEAIMREARRRYRIRANEIVQP